MSDSLCRLVFNSIVAICVVMAIGLTAEWYVAGGPDVREAAAIIHRMPTAVWIVCGLFAFYAVFLLFLSRFFGFLKMKDDQLREMSPKSHHSTKGD
jgi:hypothetical protein